MKRKHKTYSKPKRPFDKTRIDEEAEIKKQFGLKNKKEIWKADAKVKSFREKAKKLISADPEEQEALFGRLKKIGLKVNSIGDVLALDKKDYLNRRLQSVLVTKHFVTTPKTARQLITHKKVLVDGKIVNSPSFIVPVELESKISLKPMKMKKKAEKDTPSQSMKENDNKEESEQTGATDASETDENKEDIKDDEEKKDA